MCLFGCIICIIGGLIAIIACGLVDLFHCLINGLIGLIGGQICLI